MLDMPQFTTIKHLSALPSQFGGTWRYSIDPHQFLGAMLQIHNISVCMDPWTDFRMLLFVVSIQKTHHIFMFTVKSIVVT